MNTENKFNYVLVGGTFNDNKGKESGVVNKLYHALGTFNSVMYNGGNYFDLVGNALSSITETDLIIWMADVDNAKEKIYPVKNTLVHNNSNILPITITKLPPISAYYII